VTTDEQGEKLYEYGMMGKLEKIDNEKSLMVLRDKKGKRWNFDFSTQIYPAVEGVAYRKLMVVEVLVDGKREQTSEIKYHLYRIDQSSSTEGYLRVGDLMMAVWQDKRSLTKIIDENSRDTRVVIPLVVIPKDKGIIPIYKIVGENK
jgi:hypothetical protein